MAGAEPDDVSAFPLQGLRLAAPQTLVLGDMDATVSRTYGAALTALSKAGVRITDIPLPELDEIAAINRLGGFSSPQAYAWHRGLIAQKGALYDPRVLVRIMRGKEQDAAHYVELTRTRADLIRRVAAVTCRYDALVMPTVPIIAPALAPLAAPSADEAYRTANMLVLRNPGASPTR